MDELRIGLSELAGSFFRAKRPWECIVSKRARVPPPVRRSQGLLPSEAGADVLARCWAVCHEL